MTLAEFSDEVLGFNKKIEKEIYNPEGQVPILDGPLSIEGYYNAPLKILWLMKEPYGAGGFDFTNILSDDYDSFLNDFVRGDSKTTWQPVVYTTHGIINQINWDDIPFIRDNPISVQSLKSIAWVNIQKFPSKNGTRTNMSDVENSYRNNKVLINKQIDMLSPDIIICGGLYRMPNFFEDIFGYSIQEKLSNSSASYRKINNRLIVSAYHPAYPFNKKNYTDDIVNITRVTKNSF